MIGRKQLYLVRQLRHITTTPKKLCIQLKVLVKLLLKFILIKLVIFPIIGIMGISLYLGRLCFFIALNVQKSARKRQKTPKSTKIKFIITWSPFCASFCILFFFFIDLDVSIQGAQNCISFCAQFYSKMSMFGAVDRICQS